MGIEGTLHQVAANQLKKIIKDHELVDQWIYYEDEDPGMMIDDGLSLGRSLYGLNFIITGDPVGGNPPECYAIFGKHELFSDEGGIHSCDYLLPDEVKEVSAALSLMTKENLRSRFDVATMNEMPVYPPAGWEESDFEYLYELFRELVAYYKKTVRNKNAMILLVH